MKKTGYVTKKFEKNSSIYLEVLDVSSLPCCDLSTLSHASSNEALQGETEGMKLHDCSTCSGCTSFLTSKDASLSPHTITVLNKEKRNVNIGEKIEYCASSWNVFAQVFLFLLLPTLTFALIFLLLSNSGFGEGTSIFVSLTSCLTLAIASSFVSHFFLHNVFIPKLV